MGGVEHTPDEFRKTRAYGVAKNFIKEGIEARWAGPEGLPPAVWGSEDFTIAYEQPFLHGAFSPDEKFLAFSTKNAVKVYSTGDWELRESLTGPTETVSHVEWRSGTSEGYILACIMWFDRHHIQTRAHQPEIISWDLDNNGRAVHSLIPVNSAALAGAVALEAKELLKSRYQWTDQEVQAGGIVEGFTETLERAAAKQIIDKNISIQGNAAGNSSSLFSDDGNIMLVSTTHIEVWDTKPLRRRLSLEEKKSPCFAVSSPDSKIIATTALHDQTTSLWSSSTGELLHSLGPSGGTNWYARFSPDGRLLAHGCEVEHAGLQIWDVATGRKVYAGQNLASWLRSYAWSPDSKRIAFSAKGGALRILDVTTGVVQQEWQASGGDSYGPYTEIPQIQWIDGGRKICWNTGLDYGVEVYDVMENVKWRFAPSNDPEFIFKTNIFANDPALWCQSKRLLCLVCADGRARLWKLEKEDAREEENIGKAMVAREEGSM
jgi:WD40 repeat protein